MLIDAIKSHVFPCEKRLNEVLDAHKKEFDKTIVCIRENRKIWAQDDDKKKNK